MLILISFGNSPAFGGILRLFAKHHERDAIGGWHECDRCKKKSPNLQTKADRPLAGSCDYSGSIKNGRLSKLEKK